MVCSPEILFLVLLLCLQISNQSLAETAEGRPRSNKDHWSKFRKQFNPFRRQVQPTGRLFRGLASESNSLGILAEEPDCQLKAVLAPEANDSSTAAGHTPWIQTIVDIFQKWGKVFTSCAQIGIVVYLAHAIWTAAVEVVEEYMEEVSGSDPSGFSREQVFDAIRFLEQPPEVVKAQLENAQMESSREGGRLPHMPTLQIAQKLAMAGAPLRSSFGQDSTETVSRPSVESLLLSLTRSEVSVLQQCLWVAPMNQYKRGLSVWNDIVGLESVKNALLSTVKLIIGRTQSSAYGSLFEHSSAYFGTLLYGPPGCGKSFLIKALSSESRLPCLVISPSLLLRKYVGETNQQCRSLFSLAQKLAPCILCIDEVDGLFRERSELEHEVSRDLKTEFLQYLDGMMSTSTTGSEYKRRNLVLAATNRPFDVDPAILRRLTQSHFVDMPDVGSRSLILRNLLRPVPKDPSMDIMLIASKTEGYSPSDLTQLLQTAAAAGPLRESVAHPPPLSTQHVLDAMRAVSPTPMSSSYRWALASFARSQNPGQVPGNSNSQDPSSSNFFFATDNRHVVSKWETDHGNFYHLGNFRIESATFEKLELLVQLIMQFEGDGDDVEDYDLDNNDDG